MPKAKLSERGANPRQRERAEAGEFCESRRLEAQLGIAVKREWPRQVPPTAPYLIGAISCSL